MNRFVRFLPWLVAILLVAAFLRPARQPEGPDPHLLTGLPVLDGGRLKPWETIARSTLLRTRAKQSALDAEGHRITASAWLADLLFDPPRAATHRVHRVDDPDLLALLGREATEPAHLSFDDLRPHFAEIERLARLVPEDSGSRSRFQHALVRLRGGLLEIQRLEDALVPHVGGDAPLAPRLLALAGAEPSTPGDLALVRVVERMATGRPPLAIPLVASASGGSTDEDGVAWTSAGQAWRDQLTAGRVEPLAMGYAAMADAWRSRDVEAWNAAATQVHDLLEERGARFGTRLAVELAFQARSPFDLGIRLYVLVFLVAVASWVSVAQAEGLRRAAWLMLAGTFAVHTLGLALRVYLSGYAPVTNLYSSAVFVGWGVVLFALPLERFQRTGLPTAMAALAGFASLVVAHQLAVLGSGDTLEMMRAVLDSNFWLSTHVVTITLGYSATFLAGFLAAAGLLRGVVGRATPASTASLSGLVFGVTCFALLFSFVGTVLGGVWADQSWGRFWGWDPKENGALLVVVWNALLIHARVGRVAGHEAILRIAVLGNVVTAWSWFGTNMLGVGLHAYGFMDRAFAVLLVFWLVNLAVAALPMRAPRTRVDG